MLLILSLKGTKTAKSAVVYSLYYTAGQRDSQRCTGGGKKIFHGLDGKKAGHFSTQVGVVTPKKNWL